ncbi:hypothetical protein BDW66DRAFT_61795 [Aspergillus desertorum]
MEIDPRLHRGETGPESVESDSEYPEPPAQPSQYQLSSTLVNAYARTQSAHPAHPGEHSSAYPAHISPQNELNPNDPNSELRKPRACESCRQLKVRCEPDATPDKPCKRCAKAGRSCIVTVPNRKRQKKTDSRVTELERKIDVLTATLHATQKIDLLLPSKNTAQTSSPSSFLRGEENMGRRWLVPGQSTGDRSIPVLTRPGLSGIKRQYSGDIKDRGAAATRPTPSQASNPSPATDNTESSGRRRSIPSMSWPATKPENKENAGVPDIIDRGLVSYAVASDAFTRYVDEMCHHIPMVVFPPGTQMSEVRRNKPVLFHAIVAVAMGPFEPSAQSTLLREFYRTVTERVFLSGEKSLELIQCLLIAVNFYTPPENFQQMTFFQLSQLAVAIGMDIGMHRKRIPREKPIPTGRPFSLNRESAKQLPTQDSDSPEVRRAWLGCYFTSIVTSSALRRPNIVRWMPYTDECVEILESSPDALPTDKKMVHWAKLGRIIEEIGSQFFSDDLGSHSFSDTKSLFTIKAFEKQLDQWAREASSKYDSPIMTQAQAIVNIYLHENALDTLGEHKPAEADITDPTAADRVTALSSTLSSIHEALDTVVAIPPKQLISVPIFTLARTVFAFVALIKLYSIVTAPDSYIGQVIDPKALRVECYMDKVIAQYVAAGSLAGGVAPGKFSTVMTMIRETFKSLRDQAESDAPRVARGHTARDPAQQADTSQFQTQNTQTPLRLLSELVTGEPNQSQQQYQEPSHRTFRTAASTGLFNTTSQASANFNSTTNSNAATEPSLFACITPPELPSQSPTTTSAGTNANTNPTTDSGSWSSYDSHSNNHAHSQGPYYQPTQFDSTTTTTARPNQHTQPPTTNTPPSYDFIDPNMAMTIGMPADNSMPGGSTSMSMPMSVATGITMGMFASDLGLGLDDEFLNSLGLGFEFGYLGGEMPAWMPQGQWSL